MKTFLALTVTLMLSITGCTRTHRPAAAVVEVRPLVAPTVPLAVSGPRLADPLKGLTFPVPNSETDYDHLTAIQRQQLLAALASTDCSVQSASPAPTRVACDETVATRSRTAYLLGPTLFGGDDLTDARAMPSDITGSTRWTVLLTLDNSATGAWRRYTSAHHATDTAGDPTRCASSGTPCADYVAFLENGAVVSAPLTLAPLGAQTQISGFNQQGATTLAHQLHP